MYSEMTAQCCPKSDDQLKGIYYVKFKYANVIQSRPIVLKGCRSTYVSQVEVWYEGKPGTLNRIFTRNPSAQSLSQKRVLLSCSEAATCTFHILHADTSSSFHTPCVAGSQLPRRFIMKPAISVFNFTPENWTRH